MKDIQIEDDIDVTWDRWGNIMLSWYSPDNGERCELRMNVEEVKKLIVDIGKLIYEG